MQQTEKYKLNLIEPTDPFLPEALNQNTLKLEQVVSQHLEGMGSRVTAMEAHKVAFGTYQGTWQTDKEETAEQFIYTGFSPKFMMNWHSSNNGNSVYASYFPTVGAVHGSARSAADGFYVSHYENGSWEHYQFLAFC